MTSYGREAGTRPSHPRPQLSRCGALRRIRALTLLVGLLFAVPGGALVQSGPAQPGSVQPLIADFDVVEAVVTHRMLDEVAPEVNRLLTRLLGDRHFVDERVPCTQDEAAGCHRATSDLEMVWMRDYQPIYQRAQAGALRIVRYLSPDSARGDYLTDVAAHGPARNPLHIKALSGRVHVMPLVHENGNLVTDGQYVFLSHRVFADNGPRGPVGPHLTAAGHRHRSPEEVLAVLAESLQRPLSNLVVLPGLPGNRSGHIDLYLMALEPGVLLVPRVPPEALDLVERDADRILGQNVAAFLDHHASLLRSVGFRVERLPMLAPLVDPMFGAGALGGPEVVFLTPTNALLLRTPEVSAVVLPTLNPGGPPAVRALQQRFEDEWRAFFRARGYEPHFAEVGGVARRGGLVRCVTAPVPR